ncbi:NUP82 [Candida margitis]|uniref:NUP82 n=1 Tax=Candida margitis TaxID=1775924 RepID=UPI0022273B8D|nr:NUP82 [Candida margitis]KAI5961065.1 NUP82 [Candida margitis]
MTDKLISSITKQLIFQHNFPIDFNFTNAPKTKIDTILPPSIPHNKLICRNNSELFFASGNLVRCCSINPVTSNYKLLKTPHADFEVVSLEINESGTFLAIVGDSVVDIVSLPPVLNTKQKAVYIEEASYRISDVGKVRKVLWQSIVANDSMVVILNENSEVFGFELKKSVKIPAIKISFDEKINSVSFGSRSKINDGLKLYASTDDKVVSVDFYNGSTRIAVSEYAIDVAISDSQNTIEIIKDKFPGQSNLLSSAEAQLKVYESLRGQLSNNLREVRALYTENPYELFTVELKLSTPDYKPQTVAQIGADDLVAFGDNEQIALLATIKNDTISYFSNIIGSGLVKYAEPEQLTYSKPKRGFGFVDPFDEINTEKLFWQQDLNSLEFLQSEKLPFNGKAYLRNLTGCDSKFVAVVDGSLVVVNCEWVSELLSDLDNDSVDSVEKINPTYNLLSAGKDLQGFAVITKFDSEVGVIVRDNLEIVTTNADDVAPKKDEEKEPLKIDDKPFVPSLAISAEPFTEIESNLKTLEKSVSLKNEPSMKLEPTVEVLEKLNKDSLEINQAVFGYSVYAIKLQSRTLAQLKSLKLQVETIKNLTDDTPYNNEIDDRISKIFQKQEDLDSRMKHVQSKINEQMYKIQNVPLSKEEKEYFEEINAWNQTTVDLIDQLKVFSDEVEEFKNTQPAEEDQDEKVVLENLQLQNRVKKLLTWLKFQGSEIHDLMERVSIKT